MQPTTGLIYVVIAFGIAVVLMTTPAPALGNKPQLGDMCFYYDEVADEKYVETCDYFN